MPLSPLALPTVLARLPVLAAPHRVFFALGALQLLFALAWWSSELILRLTAWGGLPGMTVPPRWAHALLAVFSVFPLFVFGFLMTVIPRWLGQRPLPQNAYGFPALALAAGWGLADAGLFVPGVLLPGLLVAGVGWLGGTLVLAARLRAPHAARQHAIAAVVASLAGTFGLLLMAVALVGGSGDGVRWALQIGVWGCLVPILVVVAHRMLPFFTSSALPHVRPWNPLSLLWGLLAASVLHGVLAGLGLPAWLWLADVPLALMSGVFSWRLGWRASFQVRLLATHHVALAWLAVASGLSALQSLALLSGVVVGGLAPLHALTLGFFLSLVLGMGTRVTLGHSGHAPAASPRVWRLFWMLQGLVVLRVLADVLPSAMVGWILALVALGALGVFGAWARDALPLLCRPRADGQAG